MADFHRVLCPICDNTTDFDYLAEQPTLAYRCRVCGLGIEAALFADPLGAYARTTYDKARNAGQGGERWRRFHHDSAVAADRYRQLAAVLPKQVNGARWVDIGCGNGALLAYVRRCGWSPCGVEADATAANEITELLGFPVVTNAIWAASPPGSASCISFFDVLEHLIDLVGAFLHAARTLHEGGLLIVEVPDLGDKTSIRDWKHRRLSAYDTDRQCYGAEHIYHLSQQSLSELASRYAPELRVILTNRPREDRLQMVWRKEGDPRSPAGGAVPAPAAPRLQRVGA